MKPQLFPLLFLALAGCRETTVSVAAQNETPLPTPIEVKTPLDTYLARPESAYKWQDVSDGEFADGDFNLRLTSQTWQGRPWTHRLQIFKPDNLKHPDAALLNIPFGGGSMGETLIGKALADATGAYVVNVYGVPNQPLFGKTEDELIAYTFAKYLETGDETWPLLFPMTKSVTKAMDALGEWSGKNGGPKISRFLVSGASKRGWTTYLAAAGDKRVIGAAPIVYNNLNIPLQIAHQRAIWKETSPMISAYADLGLFDQMGSERGKKLVAMVDPYHYRARLTMPKLLINAANDDFWPLDALQFYRAGLEGQTDLFNVPNAPHSLGQGVPSAVGTAAAWGRSVLEGKVAPKVNLKVENSPKGRVFSLSTDGAPRVARLWLASSNSPDFRRATWKSIELQPRDGAYRATVAEADLLPRGAKFAAAWGEIEISAQPLPLRLSSELWQSEK